MATKMSPSPDTDKPESAEHTAATQTTSTTPRRRHHVTPGTKTAAALPPLPPLTPLVTMVSAKVLSEAEKKLESLANEVEELKRKDKQREKEWKLVQQTAVEPVELALDDPSLAADLEKLQREMAAQYAVQREQMHKRLQKAFFEEQAKSERQRVRFSGPVKDESGLIQGEGLSKGDKGHILVVTLGQVPGFQLSQSLGSIKAIVPRSLLIDKSTPEELAHGLQLANIVRREVFERLLNIARKRGANAIISFEYKSRVKPKDTGNKDEQTIVEIMACGIACVLKKALSDVERRRQRDMEQRQTLQHNTPWTAGLDDLPGPRRTGTSGGMRQQPQWGGINPNDLLSVLRKQQSNGRQNQRFSNQDNYNFGRTNEDRDAAMLRSLLGPKVRFADENRSTSFFKGPGPSRTPRNASSRPIEDALLAALGGQSFSLNTPRRNAADWYDPFSNSNDEQEEKDKKPMEEEKAFTWSVQP